MLIYEFSMLHVVEEAECSARLIFTTVYNVRIWSNTVFVDAICSMLMGKFGGDEQSL